MNSNDEKQLKHTYGYLYAMRDMFKKGTIGTLFSVQGNNTRFCDRNEHGNVDATLKKLQDLLLFQYGQSVIYDADDRMSLRKKLHSPDVSNAEKLDLLMPLIIKKLDTAISYIEQHDYILASDKKTFEIPGSKDTALISNMLNKTIGLGYSERTLVKEENVGRGNEAFENNNILNETSIYITSLDTLMNKVPHIGFEDALSWAMNIDGYFTKGYPHDLLTHDANCCVRDRDKVVGIILNKDHCSTYSVYSDSEWKPQSEDTVQFSSGFTYMSEPSDGMEM